jgi:hypothetical protein
MQKQPNLAQREPCALSAIDQGQVTDNLLFVPSPAMDTYWFG